MCIRDSYQAAACALNGAAAQIEAGRTLRIPDGQGSTVELDGNFWSNGDLDALSQRRDSLEQQLQQANEMCIRDSYKGA